ncbi:MAG TPA: asparagine synthase (glutamine-hydrolyzing) [Gemmatimonadaceae bacterium]
MCGIAGAFAPLAVADSVTRMTNALHHRGPDDVGFADLLADNGRVAGTFGHRRLSILDLSMAGHQPMLSRDGRYCLSYNGEIYNFRELRSELEQRGFSFGSSGDTEVLLATWECFGREGLGKIRGMFALAVWDRLEMRGFLARDEFGIKPLYYTEQHGIFLFASEVRALLASDIVPRSLSSEALQSYLASGSVSEPLTIIEGVRAVPPGCVLEIRCDGERPRQAGTYRFAALFDAGPEDIGRMADPAVALREAMRDSVAHHLISDVPVGLFLSGGLDSSSVVALASEISDSTIDTFTVTFSESRYSEAEPALEVARRYSTRHHEILLSASDLLNALPDAFAAMDQPSLDGLNTYVVSRAVRAYGIKVVLSGLGGDELFAGYPSFRRASALASLWRLPADIRKIGTAGASRFRDARMQRIGDMLREETPAFGAYVGSRTLFGRQQIRGLTGSFTAKPGSPFDEAELDRVTAMSVLQQVSFYEITGYMRNTLLRDSDVFSMAHGLELRVPFVDRRVAHAAFVAPDARKLKRGVAKPLLVDAMGDLLPASLLNRAKQGFTIPFQRWMKSELADEIDAVLESSGTSAVGLEKTGVRGVWNDFQRGRPGINWSRPWALYTLLRWARHNDVSLSAPGSQAAPALA